MYMHDMGEGKHLATYAKNHPVILTVVGAVPAPIPIARAENDTAKQR